MIVVVVFVCGLSLGSCVGMSGYCVVTSGNKLYLCFTCGTKLNVYLDILQLLVYNNQIDILFIFPQVICIIWSKKSIDRSSCKKPGIYQFFQIACFKFLIFCLKIQNCILKSEHFQTFFFPAQSSSPGGDQL